MLALIVETVGPRVDSYCEEGVGTGGRVSEGVVELFR